MAFFRGQRVTMKRVHTWNTVAGPLMNYPDPIFGEIYIVTNVHNGCDGDVYLNLVGFVPGYWDELFRPVVEPRAELPASITALLDSKNHTPLPEWKLAPSFV